MHNRRSAIHTSPPVFIQVEVIRGLLGVLHVHFLRRHVAMVELYLGVPSLPAVVLHPSLPSNAVVPHEFVNTAILRAGI